MGGSSWSDSSYDQIKQQRSAKTSKEIFTSSKVDPALNPHGLRVRESRDSAAHPRSNPLIVAFDVTGSMGTIPEQFARQKLGKLMQLLLDGKFIEDPQILFAAVGDAYSDRGPFQVGQFESGLEMDMWLTRIWLEKGGGGQKKESYGLAHYFAAHHTSVDSFEKRNKKGFLFTMGDELSWDLPAEQVERIFGTRPATASFSMEELVKAASEKYEVFHIVIAQGHHGKDPEVIGFWQKLLHERALVLEDLNAICELIAVTVGLQEGVFTLDDAARELRQRGTEEALVRSVQHALTPFAKITAGRRAQ